MTPTTHARRNRLELSESVYLVAVVKGLLITIRHVFRNLFGQGPWYTVLFPERRVPFPARFRAKHRLTRKEDGSPRCTSCMCCATACPAGCIYIEASEVEDASVEKAPRTFDIDTLVCVYCGFCVEACPCDAIRMDTGLFPRAEFERSRFIDDIETLLGRPGATEPVPGEPEGIAPISGPWMTRC